MAVVSIISKGMCKTVRIIPRGKSALSDILSPRLLSNHNWSFWGISADILEMLFLLF